MADYIDYHSKRTGAQIEDLLDQVASGNTGGGGGGGITDETDPIFSASPAASITEDKITEWNNKYTKPEYGISKADLDQEVNDILHVVEVIDLPELKGSVDGLVETTNDLNSDISQLYNDDSIINQAIERLRADLDALVSGDTTTAIKTFNEVIAFLDGIQDSQDLSSIIASIEQQIAGKMNSVTLATVATSGSYNDLKDKPTIPSAVTESTVSGWGFTKNAGTITEVTVNDESVGNSGKVNIPKASTSRYGVVKLTNETNNTSTSYAATAKAVKDTYDHASSRQEKLVSGTNIKTINNQSILGSGNITISSGGDGGVSPTVEFVSGKAAYIEIFDNVIYICEQSLQSLEIYASEQLNVGSIIRFYTSSDFTLEMGDVLLANGVIPNFEPNTIYELSIASNQMTDEMLVVLTPFKPV